LTILVSGWSLFALSSVFNPFFEIAVRLQQELGHHVVDRGPYAYIRHPGYVGLIAASGISNPLLFPFTLISVLSLIVVPAIVIRTALEDRVLLAELAGYRDYAARVRFRLISGVW
jgi:protein-S-isoprenylcysteine O-methyltransferase Ste14